MFENIYFESSALKLFGVLAFKKACSLGAIFLHGGSQSSSKRFEFLQNFFLNRNIASLAIDFRGCGLSEGNFSNGSLLNRIKDAEEAVGFFQKKTGLDLSQIYIWGLSMGGYVVCRISVQFPKLKGLVLQSPAAYGKEAESTELGEEFTLRIRRPDDWSGSEAFSDLDLFKGRILVVYGKHDIDIPEGVKNRYREIAGNRKGKSVILEDGAHRLLSPQNDVEKTALKQLAEIAVEFIEK
ncbi:alpha/beta fold hydrolase [Candidatus Collierbacteria bacterium]|nr:alpha/beta fold hydrolase [Candidatus Collierbacteria bacterium]